MMNMTNNESDDNPKNGITLSLEEVGQTLSHLESTNQMILDREKSSQDDLEVLKQEVADLRYEISMMRLSHNVCDSCAISYMLKGLKCRAGGE